MRLKMGRWIVFVFIVSVAFVRGQCPSGWIQNATSCYRIRFDTESWIEALDICKLAGAHLVEIGDEIENEFVYGIMPNKGNVWLGGSDLSIEGEWMWMTSHSDMPYTKWRPTEPNNQHHDENCLEMDPNGLWNDRTCHYVQNYVCEKELGATEDRYGLGNPFHKYFGTIYNGVAVHGQCPNGWIHHDTSCYRLRFDTETWIDAMNVCKLDDAYLVEIEDERENNFIHGLTTDNLNVWLGGTDLSSEGEWIWITSHSNIAYAKWRPTEPNNNAHDENCLEMDAHGLWNDRACHYVQKYVCEKKLA